MDPVTKKNWRQRSWTIPLSVLLHVLIVGVFYMQWPESIEAPAEPESVSVELVEPPKEEPPKEEPKPQPEETKAEEPPPPPAEEKPKEPARPQPSSSQMPSVPIRPEPTQLDKRDEPGEQEGGGEEQPKQEPQAEAPQPATAPSQEPDKAEQKPESPASAATTEQGEIPAAESSVPNDKNVVAVAVPKPETKSAPEQEAKVLPDGEANPKLKPAKKILAAAKRPGPMMRQIFGNLPPRDRVRQLCFAEVVSQITAARKGQSPEGVQDQKRDIVDNVLDAKGAFNVGSQWFPIDYRCEVDIDKYIVTDFRYEIRPELSSDDVKRLNLGRN